MQGELLFNVSSALKVILFYSSVILVSCFSIKKSSMNRDTQNKYLSARLDIKECNSPRKIRGDLC